MWPATRQTWEQWAKRENFLVDAYLQGNIRTRLTPPAHRNGARVVTPTEDHDGHEYFF